MGPPGPIRLQLRRARGFDLQALSSELNGLPALNCSRPSLLGNPWRVGPGLSRAQAVALHQAWFEADDASRLGYAGTRGDELEALRTRVRARLEALAPVNLACWCPLPARGFRDVCHCAVMVDFVRSVGGCG